MHPRKGITTEHCRHNDGGPDLADPEARARLVDDMLEDLRHTYVGSRVLPITFAITCKGLRG